MGLSNLLIVSKSGPANSIKILDIWWVTLDKMDNFKLNSRMVFFRFIIVSFVKKIFLNFFLVGHYISNYNKNIEFAGQFLETIRQAEKLST